jgi:hypothetical protein
MPGYRLYFFTTEGHIENAAEFVCADDAEASLNALDHRDGRIMELWSGARVVEVFPAVAQRPESVPGRSPRNPWALRP